MDEDQPAEPSTSHAASKGKEKVQEDICVICLDRISERAIAVPCNHCAFDFICLVSWLQDHPQCPLCKASLTAVEYDWRSPDDHKTFLVRSLAPPPTISSQCPSRLPRSHCFQRRARGYRGRHPVGRPSTDIKESEVISWRRHVYRRQLYSLHVGSSPQSRFRDFTPATFAKSPDLESRARMWIRRELQVFDFLGSAHETTNTQSAAGGSNGPQSRRKVENAEFLLSYIVSILATVDIKSSSGAAQRLLADFLGDVNAALFLHELSHWLRSPYTQLDNWDRNVQYAEKLPVYERTSQRQSTDVQQVPWGGNRSSTTRASSSRRWSPY